MDRRRDSGKSNETSFQDAEHDSKVIEQVTSWLDTCYKPRFRLCQYFLAGDVKELYKYIRAAKNVNGKCGCCGNSMLHLAVAIESHSLVKKLLKRRADVNSRNDVEGTPLHQCCVTDNSSIAELLLQHGADPNASDDSECTPLHLSVKCYRMYMVNLLLSFKASTNRLFCPSFKLSPMHVVARSGSVRLAQALLSRGASVNRHDRSGVTPIYAAVETGDEAMLEELLRHGASVHATYRERTSLLHLASRLGREAMVVRLLEVGCDPRWTDEAGVTSLHLAAEHGYPRIVEILVNAKADVNAMDARRRTPLFLAVAQNQSLAINALLHFRASADGLDALVLRAARAGCFEVIESLACWGISVQSAKAKKTALQLAVNFGREAIVRFLVQQGADVNVRGKNNIPLLNEAICMRSLRIAKILVDAGADVTARDGMGRTPMYHAIRADRPDIMWMLMGSEIQSVIDEARDHIRIKSERKKKRNNDSDIWRN